jgi:hypothetical protein
MDRMDRIWMDIEMSEKVIKKKDDKKNGGRRVSSCGLWPAVG